MSDDDMQTKTETEAQNVQPLAPDDDSVQAETQAPTSARSADDDDDPDVKGHIYSARFSDERLKEDVQPLVPDPFPEETETAAHASTDPKTGDDDDDDPDVEAHRYMRWSDERLKIDVRPLLG